ncbi:hypothetical protein CEXT_650251 [Caerostris extrusa]|uniref:Uncharacterized protein n=1 Tax=Caerostris extrusa TaxID=172846 RepID=A0AAV4MZJ4_CAEEX|nr:hypothetical protein CEXT_650251 [Caerostris extrusa]
MENLPEMFLNDTEFRLAKAFKMVVVALCLMAFVYVAFTDDSVKSFSIVGPALYAKKVTAADGNVEYREYEG